MDFGILGPLTVHTDGTATPIRGQHPPRLLARLLIDAGRVVTVDQLEDVLWRDDRPATARRQVQNAMAALRRTLGVTAIAVEREGYRLDTEHNAVDARCFADLTAIARGLAEHGQTEAARHGYRDALALWRGPALADLSEPEFVTAAARLDESRLATVEAWASLEVDAGNPSHVADTLAGFLARQPLRQHLAGLLMRALDAEGRTGEALDVYDAIRCRLDTELGLDPRPRLTELHTRLRRTRSVALPPPVGIDDSAEKLTTLDSLSNGGGIAVVSASGTDPTAPVLHWAHRVRERFPDGHLYLDLHGSAPDGPLTSTTALRRLLAALGHGDEPPSEPDDAAALYRSLLTGRRTLILLADAHDADQVRPLLPGSATITTVVTSRRRLTGLVVLDDAVAVRLDAD